MPSLSVDLGNSGRPVIDVLVSMNYAQEQQHRLYGLPLPQPVLTLALVDTGSSRTFIDQEVLDDLCLEVVGTERVVTPSSGVEGFSVKLYAVDVSLPDGSELIAASLVIGSMRLDQLGVKTLLGRDVLKGGHLHYDGEHNLLILRLKKVTRPS